MGVGDSLNSDVVKLKGGKYDWSHWFIAPELELDNSGLREPINVWLRERLDPEKPVVLSKWGQLLRSARDSEGSCPTLSLFGADVREHADLVCADVLELGAGDLRVDLTTNSAF